MKSLAQDTFQTGQLVMVPFWGLSQVVGYSRDKVLGQECDFCHIVPLRLDEPIKYTHQTMVELGIRPLMTAPQIRHLAVEPLQVGEVSNMPGTRRYQRWIRLLRSGRAGARRKILTEMAAVEAAGSILRFREKDLRMTVEKNYRAEVTAVLHCSAQKAAEFVRQSCRLELAG